MEANQDEQKSLLPSLRQHHEVRVYNPLTKPFEWRVARSFTSTDPKLQDPYLQKAQLRHGDHPTMAHVQQPVVIPATGYLNMPGDVAQVVVKHLIDAILNQRNPKMKSDPLQRLSVEQEVIPKFADLREKVTVQSIEDQFAQQLRDMNPEGSETVEQAPVEQAFPTLNEQVQDEAPQEPAFPSVIPKSVGRPAKAKQTA